METRNKRRLGVAAMTAIFGTAVTATMKGIGQTVLATPQGDSVLARTASFLVDALTQPGIYVLWYLGLGLMIGSQYEAWVRQGEADDAASERALPIRALKRKARELRAILRNPILRALSRAKRLEAVQLSIELDKVGYPPLPFAADSTNVGRLATLDYLDIVIPHLCENKVEPGRRAAAAFLEIAISTNLTRKMRQSGATPKA